MKVYKENIKFDNNKAKIYFSSVRDYFLYTYIFIYKYLSFSLYHYNLVLVFFLLFYHKHIIQLHYYSKDICKLTIKRYKSIEANCSKRL